MKLKQNFLDLLQQFSDKEEYNLKCWEEIEKKYTSKSRYYHNLTHLENMFHELELVKTDVRDTECMMFSIYYHDIVYKATRSDNEHQSALLFEKRISPTRFSSIAKCKDQIEATKAHLLSEDHDTNILLDIDLSILGSDSVTYNQYCLNIRKEYKIYPDFMYKKGRKKVLQHILESESIYNTEHFIQKYEQQARANMQLELESL